MRDSEKPTPNFLASPLPDRSNGSRWPRRRAGGLAFWRCFAISQYLRPACDSSLPPLHTRKVRHQGHDVVRVEVRAPRREEVDQDPSESNRVKGREVWSALRKTYALVPALAWRGGKRNPEDKAEQGRIVGNNGRGRLGSTHMPGVSILRERITAAPSTMHCQSRWRRQETIETMEESEWLTDFCGEEAQDRDRDDLLYRRQPRGSPLSRRVLPGAGQTCQVDGQRQSPAVRVGISCLACRPRTGEKIEACGWMDLAVCLPGPVGHGPWAIVF